MVKCCMVTCGHADDTSREAPDRWPERDRSGRKDRPAATPSTVNRSENELVRNL